MFEYIDDSSLYTSKDKDHMFEFIIYVDQLPHRLFLRKKKKYLLLILKISVNLLYLHTLAVITANHPLRKLERGKFNYHHN